MNNPKQPTSPPPAYTVATLNSSENTSPNHVSTPVAYTTYPDASYIHTHAAATQPHSTTPQYVSTNGIYYTPPPPGAYPGSGAQGYTQAYVPGQTIIIKDHNRNNEAAEDSLCACLMGALLCCCCLEMLY